ncbi:hypothetical protein [Edaphobacter aggregans]|uniref:hypothetical protein n=1 Tax=Edaphobacter aggregans TaxID=570835 RepID=UPI0012FB9EE9|nr:hypothetical protein [Edaphobacter aggregans]
MLLLASLSALVETSGASQQSTAVTELQPLAAGITLPVQIRRTLSAGKVKAGTVFFVTTTQRVPVSASAYLNHGAKVRGEVVTSEAGDGTAAHPSVLTIRFTELSYRGKTVPVETRAIAAAHFMHVGDTFLPTGGGGDNGNASQANWNTRQVGGQEVNRSGWVGDVSNNMMQKVGYADYHGVYSLPVSIEGAMVPRAMGVFSTTAKGLYGYDMGAQMESSGGRITITNPTERAVIRNHDQLLLEVVSSR